MDAGGPLQNTATPHVRNNPRVDARHVAKLRQVYILTFIFVSVSVGLYLIVQKSLIPSAPKISVTSVSVSSFKISSTFVTADWGFAFSIRNPNQFRVEYGTIEASVIYGGAVLGNTLLSPFSQRKHNETSLTVSFSALSDYLNDGAAQDLTADRARGSIQVQMKLFISLSCKCGAWPRIRIQNFNVLCRDVTLGFSSTQGAGSLSGAPRKCRAKSCW
ncbi:hypothetical protein MRB53_014638 [Persea americana]|uniref:Uncharacterized protein n=1 Tax=Persea americana TaxID=3435 RepID=A0ACC2KBV1_PERAE|nr:hypothetical protein MRB53_014638 [Persea americana]